MDKKAILVLEDGNVFSGKSIGYSGETTGEVIFNTAMTGYQEILTDPSYYNQIINFTYPHIGNTGINKYDNESKKIQASGIIIHSISNFYSHWQSNKSLHDFLYEHKITGISNIDTRKLTNIIRKKGFLIGCISSIEKNTEILLKKAQFFKEMEKNLVAKVSTKKKYVFSINRNIIKNYKYNILLYDFGVKRNILKILDKLSCQVTVVPESYEYQKIDIKKYDGIVLSNGPGDPTKCSYIVNNIKNIIKEHKEIPIFGICFGHQILALALGMKIIKMIHGHHGSNHPVKSLKDNKIFITSQNHSFTIDKKSLYKTNNIVKITHKSLFDNSIQGIKMINRKILGFQGHPEASPGTQDIFYLFKEFISYLS